MAFRGWPVEAITFFQGLEADNSKPYWTANKGIYEQSVRGPLEDLCEAVADTYGPLRIFRPYRDVRFSKDKTPYKENVGAAGEREGGAVYYVAFSAEGLFAATGYYHMASDQIERFRAAVADDTTGPEVVALVEDLDGKLDVGGEALKTAPRGYAKDHPRIRLLRHKGLTAAKSFGTPAWVHTPKAAARVCEVWAVADGLNGWLDAHVGPSELPPDGRR